MEAVVGVGAQLVTVAVREGGIPRFVRTVALPEETMARGSAEALASVPGPSTPARSGAAGAPASGVDTLYLESIVAEVRSSLEYLLSQSQSQSFEHVLLTGGGAMAPGLPEALSRTLSLPVNFAELGFEIDSNTWLCPCCWTRTYCCRSRSPTQRSSPGRAAARALLSASQLQGPWPLHRSGAHVRNSGSGSAKGGTPRNCAPHPRSTPGKACQRRRRVPRVAPRSSPG